MKHQRVAALQCQHFPLDLFEKIQIDILVRQRQDYLGRQGVSPWVERTPVNLQASKATTSGSRRTFPVPALIERIQLRLHRKVSMHEQAVLGPSHTYVIPTHQRVVHGLLRRKEHIHVIELSPLGLVYRRDHHIRPCNIAKILHRRLEDKLAEVAQVPDLAGLLEQLYATLQIIQAPAPGIDGKNSPLGILPQFLRNHGRNSPLTQVTQEIPRLGQIPETKAVHGLYQLAVHPPLAQKSGYDDRLFIGLREHARSPATLAAQQLFHKRLIHVPRLVECQFHPPGIVSLGYDRRAFHPMTDSLSETVDKSHDMARTAIILGHFHEPASLHPGQIVKVTGVGTPEFVNVLVVIAHGNHAHFLVLVHQSLHKRVFIAPHVLRLVYDQYRLADSGRFHLATLYHPCGHAHHVLHLIKVSHPA